MSFPRYTRYKDSSTEWLGEVPEHWDVTVVKRFSTLQRGHDLTDAERTAGPYPVITSGGISGTHGSFMARGPGVVTGRYGSTGRLFYIEDDFWPHNTSLYVSDFHGNAPRFVWYSLQTVDFAAHSAKAAVPGVDRNDIHVLPVAVPPRREQLAITEFLDRETAKIDGLVGEQRRLIELLKEKRQAVISHAVTKGLNPHAPMKPSGIEWLGDVPEHWDLFPLKRDLAFLTSGSRGWAENYADDGELFIRIGNLTRDNIGLDLSDIQRVTVPPGIEASRTKVKGGDVLFSVTAYLGSVAVVPHDLESAYVSQHVALARLRQIRLDPKWVGYVALSVVGKTWFDMQAYGGTKIQLSLDDVKDLVVPAPSTAEQQSIVAFLDQELARFDALTVEAERAIDLLLERRTALISAAVTGKIDVRGLAETEAA